MFPYCRQRNRSPWSRSTSESIRPPSLFTVGSTLPQELSAPAGSLAAIPIALGVIPYGLVFGVAATSAGFDIADVAAMSLVMFAAASQLIVVELVQQGSAIPVLLLAMLVINLRFVVYSASIAQHFASAPLPFRLSVAYFLTDQTFARSMMAFTDKELWKDKLAYFLGVALPIWFSWQASSVLGAAVGRRVPDRVPLSFAIPLVFLAVLVPSLRTRPLVLAAVCAGATSILLAFLPYNIGTLLGIAVGLLSGILAFSWPRASR